MLVKWCVAGEAGSGQYVASGYSVHEEENQHLQEGLRAKVTALKSVNIKVIIMPTQIDVKCDMYFVFYSCQLTLERKSNTRIKC